MRANTRALVAYVLIAIFVVGAVPAGGQPRGGQSTPTKVKMVDGNRFAPRTFTIDRGTTVKWVNKDNHDHTSTGPGWNSRLDTDDTFRRTFNQVGTFSYRCTIHLPMRGTIIVE